jgi:hypothetical protein
VDLVTAGVEVIKAIAWPSVVGLGFLLFKTEIRELFSRISRLKHKETEIEFREGVLKPLREGITTRTPESSSVPPKRIAGSLDELVSLANASPRSAVLNAWHWFKKNLIEIAEKLGWEYPDDSDDSQGKFSNAVAYLARTNRLPMGVLTAIETLTPVVTKVITLSDFEPTVKDAEEFVLYSAAIVEDLKRLN